MARLAFSVAALASLVVFGCSGEPLGEEPRTREADEGIINGTLDTTHQAVVALLGTQSECTATIVAVSGTYGFALTAAHCVTLDTPQQVVQGNDYNTSSLVYPVVSYKAHPSYNQQVYDFGMVKFNGANGSTPIIPAMQASQDTLSLGDVLDIAGYGITQNGQNSKRYQVDVTLDQGVSPLLLEYSQQNGGPCSGDSGGPALSVVGGQELVSGVTSYGDQNCVQFGASGRVSAVYDSFVKPFIDGSSGSGTQTCDECEQASTSGSGACTSQVNACFNDTACSGLVDCLNNCTTQTCVDNCVNQYPQGVTGYNNIINCVCDTACVTECASSCQSSSSASTTTSSGGPGATTGPTTTSGTSMGTTIGAGGSTGVSTGDVGGGTTTGGATTHRSSPANSDDSSGCACQVPSSSTSGGPGALAALLFGVVTTLRKRRSRRGGFSPRATSA